MESKPTNPKDAAGSLKANFHFVPSCVMGYAAMSFYEGATKYGAFNWRHSGVRASVYISALKRHLTGYENGEEFDPKTKVPHLASIIACAGVLIDAGLHGMLTDDRADASPESVALLQHVAEVQSHLKQMHAHLAPQHFLRDRLLPPPAPAVPEPRTALIAEGL